MSQNTATHVLVPTFLAITLLASSGRAEVWDVRGPAPDFMQISAAVQVAADGDLVRVWSGTYDNFLIDDVDLTVLAMEPNVVVHGTVRVHSLDAARSVELIGLSASGSDNVALLLFQCDGAVRVSNGTYQGAHGTSSSGTDSYSGAWVIDCANVCFTGCSLLGGHGMDVWDWGVQYVDWGGHGLLASSSTVTVFASTLVGGGGSSVYDVASYTGGSGGHGASCAGGGFLYIGGSTATGGQGGHGGDASAIFHQGGSGGAGGDGLRVNDLPLVSLDTQLNGASGGSGGSGWSGQNPSGPDGQPVRLLNGATHSALPGNAPTMTVPALNPDTGMLALEYSGDVGDAVFLVAADLHGFRFVSGWHAPLLMKAPFVIDRDLVGSIGGGGTLSISYPLPDLAPGEFEVWHVQSALVAPGPSVHLTPLVPIVVHDAGW